MQLIVHHIKTHPSQVQEKCTFPQRAKRGGGGGGEGEIKDINYSGGTDNYIPHFWNFVFLFPSFSVKWDPRDEKESKKKSKKRVSFQEKKKISHVCVLRVACCLFLFSFSSTSSDQDRSREGVLSFDAARWCGCPRSIRSEGGDKGGFNFQTRIGYLLRSKELEEIIQQATTFSDRRENLSFDKEIFFLNDGCPARCCGLSPSPRLCIPLSMVNYGYVRIGLVNKHVLLHLIMYVCMYIWGYIL